MPEFDFRSSRFECDARLLAQRTGQALWLCRQELFIAEGAVDEALAMIQGLAGTGQRPFALH